MPRACDDRAVSDPYMEQPCPVGRVLSEAPKRRKVGPGTPAISASESSKGEPSKEKLWRAERDSSNIAPHHSSWWDYGNGSACAWPEHHAGSEEGSMNPDGSQWADTGGHACPQRAAETMVVKGEGWDRNLERREESSGTTRRCADHPSAAGCPYCSDGNVNKDTAWPRFPLRRGHGYYTTDGRYVDSWGYLRPRPVRK